MEGLRAIPGAVIYSPAEEAARAGIVAFNVGDLSSSQVADLLSARGFAVRGGLHCAPRAHRFLGTLQRGAVRASVGYANTFEEIDVSYDGVFCDGMQMIVILTLKKKDGTPLKAPEGYEWSAAYTEESSLSPFAGKPDRRYFSQALNENDDGSLSLTYRSIIYDLHNLFSDKTKIGINGLYCVSAATTEESREITDYVNIVSEAYIKEKNLEAAEADYFAELEKYSVEYYKGSAVCEADSDGVIVKPKAFTSDYKGEEISVIATPLNIDMQCMDTKQFSEEEIKNQNWKKIQEERFSSVEIFYTDGSSETARCVGCGAGGSAKRFSFSCDYSTGKPMVISKIDYIVFDGETINFDT
jgi:hypothetical protein